MKDPIIDDRLYKQYFEWLVAFLDKRDPLNLVVPGHPGRAYEKRVGELIKYLAWGFVGEDLARVVYINFTRHFNNIRGDSSRFVAMAPIMERKWQEMCQEFDVDPEQSR